MPLRVIPNQRSNRCRARASARCSMQAYMATTPISISHCPPNCWSPLILPRPIPLSPPISATMATNPTTPDFSDPVFKLNIPGKLPVESNGLMRMSLRRCSSLWTSASNASIADAPEGMSLKGTGSHGFLTRSPTALDPPPVLWSTAAGIGTAALASLLNPLLAHAASSAERVWRSAICPRAKRVIYLFMSGGPSHIDLFDYKPRAAKAQWHRAARPRFARASAITGMTSGQKSFPCAAPIFKFAQHGKCGRVGQRAAAAHGEHRG